MERIVLVCLVVVSSAVGSLAADKMMNAAGTYVKLNEQTGSLTASMNESIDSDKNRVMVTVMALKEKMQNGTLVDSNITSVNVTFADSANTTISDMGGIAATHITTTATIASIVTFVTDVMILKADGNLTKDTETTMAKAGNIRLKMTASDLNLAENSTAQLEVKIEGKSDAPTADGRKYNLGGDAMAELSKKVKDADGFKDLAEDDIAVSGSTFTFTFPRSASLEYDVFLMLGPADTSSDDGTGSASGVTSLGLMSLLAIALLKFMF